MDMEYLSNKSINNEKVDDSSCCMKIIQEIKY
jgi:hypothetical protein